MASQRGIPLPDFLGVAGRVQTVSDLIEEGQTQLVYFRNHRIGRGFKPTDLIPHTQEAVDIPTYREWEKRLEDGITALFNENQDIAEKLVAEADKRRDAREKVHRQEEGLSRYSNTPSP